MKTVLLFLLFCNLCLAGGFSSGNKAEISGGTDNTTIGNSGSRLTVDSLLSTHKDSITNSIMTVDYAHHEAHAGSTFQYSEIVTINAAASRSVLIVTPDSTKKAHLIGSVTCTDECFVYFYEDTTVTNNGTGVTEYNVNRSSSTTNTVNLFHTPTITDNGTLLQSVQLGKDGGNPSKSDIGGGFAQRDEWILDTNSNYMLYITATNNDTDISSSLRWYEHTDTN